ncbi:MAG TPA: hypothetical protein VEU08_08480 [Vicinamibacterales bacterium]|nr:hypothetical protein [Vicinamibacterales bacterium]
MGGADAARRRPEVVAAFVNAFVVLLLPALIGIGVTLFPPNSLGTTVYADNSFAASAARLSEGLAVVEIPLLPFAMLAGWRTWVHAKRYIDGQSDGWRGVLEGSAAGFLGALLVLLPACIVRPLQAPPYVIVYGGGAAVLGLAFGLVLALTTFVTLWVLGAEQSASAS